MGAETEPTMGEAPPAKRVRRRGFDPLPTAAATSVEAEHLEAFEAALSQRSAATSGPEEKVSPQTQLQADGWLELGKLPDWDVFDMVEGYYAKYNDRVQFLLERERPRWFEDVEERDVRPGYVVARELSRRFEEKGIFISAVHPSVADDEAKDYPSTGPRFYVSVMPAAMKRGPAPPLPKDAACLLWPDEEDRIKPYITEVGWTMVPPDSDAQAMHADITSYDEEITDPRKEGHGRFHHFIWKPDRTSNCTTGVVSNAFTNGKLKNWMYDNIHRVSSPTVVLDSEMCHCGGPTGPGKWTASCTVQLCSSTGWKPLQTRASKNLLQYTCPIDFEKPGPWNELPLASQIIATPDPQEVAARRRREGGKVRWLVADDVEVMFEGAWFPASIGKRNLVAVQPRDATENLDTTENRHSAKNPDSAKSPDSAATQPLDTTQNLDTTKTPDKAKNPDAATKSDSPKKPKEVYTYLVRWKGETTFTDEVQPADIRARRWALGSQVEVYWQSKWHPAKLTKVRDDWSYRAEWDSDGTCSHQVYQGDIRERGSRGSSEELEELGDFMMADDKEPSKRSTRSKKRSGSDASTDTPSLSPPPGYHGPNKSTKKSGSEASADTPSISPPPGDHGPRKRCRE